MSMACCGDFYAPFQRIIRHFPVLEYLSNKHNSQELRCMLIYTKYLSGGFLGSYQQRVVWIGWLLRGRPLPSS